MIRQATHGAADGTGDARHPAAASDAIAVRAIHKAFGGRVVLAGVDLTVAPGMVIGLIGPNGAGKTTLIQIMTGLLAADSGKAYICGVDVHTQRGALGRRIGLAPQRLGIYPTLSVSQNLRCSGEIGGLDRRRARMRAAELLALFGLESQARQRAGQLSGGQQRRLHTAIALMHDPEVLFLDEPTVGADVTSRSAILAVISGLAEQGRTIIYTTHYLNELERLDARAPCEIAMLDDGRIRARGSLREIIARYAAPSVSVTFADEPPALDGWQRSKRTLVSAGKPSDAGAALASLLSAPALRGNTPVDVQITHADLESAYLRLTGAQP